MNGLGGDSMALYYSSKKFIQLMDLVDHLKKQALDTLKNLGLKEYHKARFQLLFQE